MARDQASTALVEQLTGADEEGLSLDELRVLNPDLTDRQIRYRLDALREEGIVRRQGKARATRYIAHRQPEGSSPSPGMAPHDLSSPDSSHAPFSARSLELLGRLERPVASRAIARYEPDWLTELALNPPLTPQDRARLHSMGATGLEHDVAGTYMRHINERLLIDLSWASSALEGNTYTLLDTRELIARGVVAEGKDRLETTMILNHKRALEFLMDAVDYDMTRMLVSNLHATLMEDLLHDTRMLGAIRERPVRISMSTYIPLDMPSSLREELERVLALARAIEDPFDASLFLLIALPYLQAFVDGNKRTARLLTNFPLFTHNVRPLSFVDVERTDYLRATLCTYEFRDAGPSRELFIHAYTRSCARYPEVLEVLPDPDPFRLAHRAEIYAIVRDVVTNPGRTPREAIEAYAATHFEELGDRTRFVAIVLTDLDALHEGNFMRYRISPDQFEAWRVARHRRAHEAKE